MKQNTIYKNIWDAKNVVFRGKFLTVNAYIKKNKRSLLNRVTLNFKELEKEEQIKHKTSRRKEITKIRGEISEIENKK